MKKHKVATDKSIRTSLLFYARESLYGQRNLARLLFSTLYFSLCIVYFYTTSDFPFLHSQLVSITPTLLFLLVFLPSSLTTFDPALQPLLFSLPFFFVFRSALQRARNFTILRISLSLFFFLFSPFPFVFLFFNFFVASLHVRKLELVIRSFFSFFLLFADSFRVSRMPGIKATRVIPFVPGSLVRMINSIRIINHALIVTLILLYTYTLKINFHYSVF